LTAERVRALELADRVLARPNADPDDDLAILARQLLRAEEYGTLTETMRLTAAKGLIVHIASRETCAEHLKSGDDTSGQAVTASNFDDLIREVRAAGLDGAWDAVEKALPDGWFFGILSNHAYRGADMSWMAQAFEGPATDPEYSRFRAAHGPTPLAALRALAAQLVDSRSVTESVTDGPVTAPQQPTGGDDAPLR